MASIYQSTLSEAWKITKKVKALWLLGVLAALPGGSGGEYERFFNLQQFEDTRRLILGMFERGNGSYGEFSALVNFFIKLDNIGYTVFALFVLVAFILLSMLAQGGLVASVLQLSKKQPWTLKKGLQDGRRYLLRVLGLNVLSRVIVYGALFLLSLPILFAFKATQSGVFSQLFYVVYFISLIPFDIIVSLMVRYAIVGMVSERQGVMESFQSAWHLFRRNWILSLEMALFLFLVSMGVGLVILLIAGVILQGMVVYIGLLNFWFTLILILVLVGGGVLAAFQYSVWTLLAVELFKGEKHESKLEQFAGSVAPQR